jgi:predicted enzyme related to lactoylglutathione lyase
MAVRIQCLVIDATDHEGLARWWAEVLGWRLTHTDDHQAVLEPPAGSPEDGVAADLLFLKVPGTKAVKNRLHIDIRPDDQDAELARIQGLGARRVDIGQGDSASWVVLADPEGNEFCLLRALTPEELAEDAA